MGTINIFSEIACIFSTHTLTKVQNLTLPDFDQADFITKITRVYLGDVLDHCVRINDELEGLHGVGAGLIDFVCLRSFVLPCICLFCVLYSVCEFLYSIQRDDVEVCNICVNTNQDIQHGRL